MNVREALFLSRRRRKTVWLFVSMVAPVITRDTGGRRCTGLVITARCSPGHEGAVQKYQPITLKSKVGEYSSVDRI